MSVALVFHILAAIIWIGGLFVVSVVLQPSARVLETEGRLSFWYQALARYLLWGWISIALLLGSGFAMAFLDFGGFAALPTYVRTMMALGIVATALYAYLHIGPWRRVRRAISIVDSTGAEKGVGQVRLVVAVTLVVGLVAAAVGAAGPAL